LVETLFRCIPRESDRQRRAFTRERIGNGLKKRSSRAQAVYLGCWLEGYGARRGYPRPT
jgi:hypothetical protein